MKKIFLVVAWIGSAWGLATAGQPALTLKDHDTWVLAGDSITAQRLHSNYIEAFFRTRYPQFHLHFRNSGIGGNRTGNILDRFDYDVADWHPTIVSVELGMNDVGGANPDTTNCAAGYIDGMKKLADKIRAVHAQPLFISSSPVNDGSILNAWASLRCHTLHPFTDALKELGQQENIRVVDQYHPLLAVWGPNKTVEDANMFAARIRLLKPADQIPDLKTLQAFAAAWGNKPSGISLGGDSVHPGPVGQYMMAATILAGLDVDREVSAATIQATGKIVETKHCKITECTAKDGKLTFTRLDERSPWPLSAEAVTAMGLLPMIADLSRYMLTVPGLPAGQYVVTMNGKPAATLSHTELANGWNMSTVREGPIAEQATKITGLISELQGGLNNVWRTASKAKDQAQLATAQKAIDENEVKLQAAVQPVAIQFEIAPAGAGKP